MPIAVNTMRLGKRYRLINFSQITEFEVMESIDEENFKIKDINHLEELEFQDLVRYGMGDDYDLIELD
jgi:hypothetical protein